MSWIQDRIDPSPRTLERSAVPLLVASTSIDPAAGVAAGCHGQGVQALLRVFWVNGRKESRVLVHDYAREFYCSRGQTVVKSLRSPGRSFFRVVDFFSLKLTMRGMRGQKTPKRVVREASFRPIHQEQTGLNTENVSRLFGVGS